MSTMPCSPSCRSCEHYLSSAGQYPNGFCMLRDVAVRVSDGCSDHEPLFLPFNKTVLLERQCVSCETVNVYALGFGGANRCAMCGR